MGNGWLKSKMRERVKKKRLSKCEESMRKVSWNEWQAQRRTGGGEETSSSSTGSTQLQRGGGRVGALREEKSRQNTHVHRHAAGWKVEETTEDVMRNRKKGEDGRDENGNKVLERSQALKVINTPVGYLSGGLSVAFLHLDPGVGVGLGGIFGWEGLLAGGAGFSRVLRLSRLRRSLLHGRWSWRDPNTSHITHSDTQTPFSTALWSHITLSAHI